MKWFSHICRLFFRYSCPIRFLKWSCLMAIWEDCSTDEEALWRPQSHRLQRCLFAEVVTVVILHLANLAREISSANLANLAIFHAIIIILADVCKPCFFHCLVSFFLRNVFGRVRQLDVSFWFCKDRCNDQAEKNCLHHFPVLEQKTKFKKIIADIE